MSVSGLIDASALRALNGDDSPAADLTPLSAHSPSLSHIDARRTDIALPGTGKFASLDFIAPLSLPSVTESLSASADPRFLFPPARFALSEHFALEWLSVPELSD